MAVFISGCANLDDAQRVTGSSMLKVFSGIYDRYFSEEEAIIFSLLLLVMSVVMLTMGAILAPLIWSIIIAYILQGLVNLLEKLRIPRRVALYLSYSLFVGVAVAIVFFFMPALWNRLRVFLNELPLMTEALRELLLLLPLNYPDFFTEAQIEQWMNAVQTEVRLAGQALLTHSISSITRLMTWLIYIVLVPIMVFFMLKDADILLSWLENRLPRRRPIMAQIWREMNDQLANYIRGKVLEIFIVGGVSYITFAWFGLNYAALLAVLIGLSVVIPLVGAFIVTLPVMIVAYLQWGFSSDFYQLLITYLIIQVLDGNLLVPLIFSETVNLHPLVIIIAVLVFGGLWGFWGVFFAIPLATFIKAIMNAWPDRYEHLDAESKAKSDA
jgi:putative permease